MDDGGALGRPRRTRHVTRGARPKDEENRQDRVRPHDLPPERWDRGCGPASRKIARWTLPGNANGRAPPVCGASPAAAAPQRSCRAPCGGANVEHPVKRAGGCLSAAATGCTEMAGRGAAGPARLELRAMTARRSAGPLLALLMALVL